MIQSSYLINKMPLGRRVWKVDMTRGYMKDDIINSIVLPSRIMGLPVVGHLNICMVHFIKTVRMTKITIDCATILSENLDE